MNLGLKVGASVTAIETLAGYIEGPCDCKEKESLLGFTGTNKKAEKDSDKANNSLKDKVSKVEGIGKATENKLAKAGVKNLEDLVKLKGKPNVKIPRISKNTLDQFIFQGELLTQFDLSPNSAQVINEGLNIHSIEALAEEFTTLSDATIRKAVRLTEVDKAFDIEELFSFRDQLQNS